MRFRIAISACIALLTAVACSTTPPAPCGRLEVRIDGLCQPAPEPADFSSEELRFTTLASPGGQIELDATLTRPVWPEGTAAPQALPGIVILSGSGPTARNDAMPGDLAGAYGGAVDTYVDLSEALARRGYVVLRYDKRTCSDHDGRCRTPLDVATKSTWTDLKMDAIAAAQFLAAQPRVDPGDIILAGHSQGGKIAVLIAPDVEGLSAVLILAGLYRPMIDTLTAQIRWQIDQVDPISRALFKKKIEEAEAMIVELEEAFAQLDSLPDDAMIMGAPASFWRETAADHARLPDVVRSITVPVLFLRGDDDHNVTAEDAEGYAAILGERPDFVNLTFPGVAHGLNVRSEDAVSDEVIQAIVDFLD